MTTEVGTAELSRVLAPYVTSWSAEHDLHCTLLVRADGRGVGYANELPGDRDAHGVLWNRVAERHGVGVPEFARVHPARQRQAINNLLCQVCAEPADRTAEGVLWLMRDFRGDSPNWPEDMASVEPPICARCVPVAMQRCPALRRGAVAVRVREFNVMGVRGTLYTQGVFGLKPAGMGHLLYGDPATSWMVAASSFRLLQDCSFVSFEELGIAAGLG
ncbi:hypothetical protein ACVDFE_21120 [Lentzea chajnantorensis]